MTVRDYTPLAVERVMQMVRLAHSVEHHLLMDQADAVAPGVSAGGRGSDISDPTFRAVAALAPFARWERDLEGALQGILRALDDAERIMTAVLSQSSQALKGRPIEAEPRCPGWNDELQQRLGGCGKHLETYRANGMDHIRSTWLCVSCRRAKQRAESEEGAA